MLISAAFNRVLQEIDKLKKETEGNSTWLREAMGLGPAIWVDRPFNNLESCRVKKIQLWYLLK